MSVLHYCVVLRVFVRRALIGDYINWSAEWNVQLVTLDNFNRNDIRHNTRPSYQKAIK